MVARDDVTRDLLGGAIRQRGRPATGEAMTAADRQRIRRERLANTGTVMLTVYVSVEVAEALDTFVQFKDVTKSSVVDRLLRGSLLRKR